MPVIPTEPGPVERLVCMTFRHEEVETFLSFFQEVGGRIRQQPGCMYLALWRDRFDRRVLFTHSRWATLESLEAYRESTLFKETWAWTRGLFAEKARAWSLDEMTRLA
ncbi:MAG: antibiotic biosynthesis monooxygenase [Saprospiraceae bacterium]|nr:antibiotic biosynthesis monooxygenase [Saprospiraceae bacterium]